MDGIERLSPIMHIDNKKDRPEALLIYPPIYDFALYDLYLKPYGLLRLGAMLEAGGWNTRVVNALDYRDPSTIRAMGRTKRKPDGTGKIHRSIASLPGFLADARRRFARYGILPEVFSERIAASRPDAVFISTGMTYWYRGAAEAADTVRRIWPGVPVITGGVYASLMPEHCTISCRPDFNSEGAAGRDLARWLENRGFPAPNIDQSILPLDHECWDEAAVLRLNEGCPLRCDYCASAKISCFREGRADAVFDRFRMIAEGRRTRNFAFYDDALLFRSEKVFKPFLRMVIDYAETTGTEFSFFTPNAMHIRYLDEESAILMKRAGFKEIRLGFESESESFHAEHDSKYTEDSFFRVIRSLGEAGFDPKQIVVYILAGLPRQHADEVEQTIRYASDRGLTLSVSEFSPVPGSGLWQHCVDSCRYPIEKEPLYHNNSFFPMQWEGFSREDMSRLKRLSKQLPC